MRSTAPDTDLEPSLDGLDHMTNQERWTEGTPSGQREIDREDEHEGREPSLGSAILTNQSAWGEGGSQEEGHQADLES
jgi:hypothetical protein